MPIKHRLKKREASAWFGLRSPSHARRSRALLRGRSVVFGRSCVPILLTPEHVERRRVVIERLNTPLPASVNGSF